MMIVRKNLCRLFVVSCMVCICFLSCVSTPKETVDVENTENKPTTNIVTDEPEVSKTTTEQTEQPFSTVLFAEQLRYALENESIDSALALFDKIPPEFSNDFDLIFLKASLLFSSGQIDEASILSEQLLERDSENLDVLMLNTMIAKDRGDAQKKSVLLKQILTRDPGNADANVEMAEEQMLRRNYSQARKFYQKALETDQSHLSALFGFGQVSYYIGMYQSAQNSFEKILKADPENAFAWAYLAKLQIEDENYKKAIDYLEKAISFAPDYYDFLIEYGSCLRHTGDFSGAEIAWSKAISIDPSYFLGYVYRSGLYDETEQFDKALDDYRQIIKLNPKYYYAYESLGMLAWYKGNWAESRMAFMKAREQNESAVSYILMISATYLKENKIKENKEFLAKAMKSLDRSSLDYAMVRLYHDQSGDGNVVQKVVSEKNRITKGKMLFYLALFYDMKGNDSLAKKYYIEVQTIQAPMFFEYRLNDWALEEV